MVAGLCVQADRPRDRMKLKIDRIISIATLVASVVAIVLVLKKPAPVAHPQSPAAIAVNAHSFDEKMERLQTASEQTAMAQQSAPPREASLIRPSGPSYAADDSSTSGSQTIAAQETTGSGSIINEQPKAEVRINSDEVGAALAQALGSAAGAQLTPDSNVGSSAPTIKDQQVSFDGDLVHGQFLTEIAGKDVWVTVSGHLGSKDGYATFDPTEFKVGDLNVPVSLVNPALQKKLAEQRDRLKLPDYVGDVKVQDSELVMQQK
jgi:hypothetical protein